MPRFEQMRDRLPTLYRPDDGDATLLTRYLSTVADALEEINAEASEVLQSHWYGYADRAPYQPFLVRGRVLEGLAPLKPGDLVDLDDPVGLITRLRAAPDPLSRYLRERFSPETRRLLDEYTPSSSTIALQRALIEGLNRIVRGPLFLTKTGSPVSSSPRKPGASSIRSRGETTSSGSTDGF